MSGEISTIQSLKAVDAWIDVINANINGGVRTAFKSSRLTFSGSNTNVVSAGNSTSLPLQFPESSLTTANTVIDFTQGAITASTENTHLAIQGDGFFRLRPINDAATPPTEYYTRDGEFRWMELPASATIGNHLYGGSLFVDVDKIVYILVNKDGLAVCTDHNFLSTDASVINIIVDTVSGNIGGWPPTLPPMPSTITLSDAMDQVLSAVGIYDVDDRQSLQYTRYGSTVFQAGPATGPDRMLDKSTETTLLTKSLEASNSSMTQSVPELSLAQKLFSALTKVLQTKQTNIDGVLNLVR